MSPDRMFYGGGGGDFSVSIFTFVTDIEFVPLNGVENRQKYSLAILYIYKMKLNQGVFYKIRDIHTYCRAFSSGAVSTCFSDLICHAWDSKPNLPLAEPTLKSYMEFKLQYSERQRHFL